MRRMVCAAVVWVAVCLGIWAGAAPAKMELAGAWQVKVTCGEQTAVLVVIRRIWSRWSMRRTSGWRCSKGRMARGTPLLGPKAEACSVAGALDPATLVVRAGRCNGAAL